jgi:peptidoglycan hydrolase-like protein with peptidoglycan-binding domain
MAETIEEQIQTLIRANDVLRGNENKPEYAEQVGRQNERREDLLEALKQEGGITTQNVAAIQQLIEKDTVFAQAVSADSALSENIERLSNRSEVMGIFEQIDQVKALQAEVDRNAGVTGGGHGAGNARRQDSENYREALAALENDLKNIPADTLVRIAPNLEGIRLNDDTTALIADARKERDLAQAVAPVAATAVVATATSVATDGQAPVSDLPNNVFGRGHAGPDVEKLQIALEKLGYDVGPADGNFGARTEAALIEFQQDRNLKETDGVYGGETRGALEAALREKLQERSAPEVTTAAAPQPASVSTAQSQPQQGSVDIMALVKSVLPPEMQAAFAATEAVSGALLPSEVEVNTPPVVQQRGGR